jgi:hypothetical protein
MSRARRFTALAGTTLVALFAVVPLAATATAAPLTDPFAPVVNAQPLAPTTTAASPGSSVPGGAGGTPTTVSQDGTDDGRLAFTGVSSIEVWIALGALVSITLGLALRPRRRSFPVPR